VTQQRAGNEPEHVHSIVLPADHKFIVVGANIWGTGQTLSAAKKAAREVGPSQGARGKKMLYAIRPADVVVTGMGYVEYTRHDGCVTCTAGDLIESRF
jgi:hypothetical protein